MERYFLLRDNRESGPYTVTELKAKGLFPTDLLWLEGESSCWKNPTEIEGLKDLVTEPEKGPAIVRKLRVDNEKTIGAKAEDKLPELYPIATDSNYFFTNETLYDPSFEENKFSFSQTTPRKKVWQQSLNIGANLFGLVTLLIAVTFMAVMVKKAVDNMENEHEEATADARGLVTESFREDASKHAALSASADGQNSAADTDDVSASNNDSLAQLAKSIVVKKEIPGKKATISTKEPEASGNTNEIAVDAMTQNTEPEGPKPVVDEAAEKAAAKATLQVSANDYKKGVFGGISDLALTISNPSSHSLENIVVEVEYLKPNGKVVGTKTVEAGTIAAGASKTVTVPDNGRGVNIRYRVMD